MKDRNPTQPLLLALNVIVLVTALWAFIESVAAMNRARREPKETEEDDLARLAEETTSRSS